MSSKTKNVSEQVMTGKGMRTMFHVCQHEGCNDPTVAYAKKQEGRKPTGSKKFCRVHAAESRMRFKARIAEQAEARETLRKAHLAAFKGRTVSRGGVKVTTARSRSALRNDLTGAGMLEKGYIRVGKDKLPAVCAALAMAGCKDSLVVVS